MPTWSQDDATCEILTYKAGLLSAVGHDLLLQCRRFRLTLDDGALEGEFDASDIEVVGAMKKGVLDPNVLSDKDKREILQNMRNGVFKKHDARAVTFVCDDIEEDDDFLEGDGTLTIPPRSHDVAFEVHIADGKAVCEVKLHQPDWGISPFKALMGTLRIQPDITVRMTVPWTS